MISRSAAIPVTLAILTYRRNAELERCLPAVLAAAHRVDEVSGAPIDVSVLVVDNDSAAEARPVIDRHADPRLRYVVEPRPGIAPARNRALDECAGQSAIVFIDDDERPEGDWPAPLIELWLLTGAAGVGGRVTSEFDIEPTGWVAAGRFFDRRSMPTGTLLQASATNNLLLDLGYLSDHRLRFDESLGLGGGEDTMVTRQITRSGGVLVWCEAALVTEHVPADRIQRRWVMHRSWSHGNTLAKVELRLSAGRAEKLWCGVRLVGRGLGRIAFGLARWAAGTALRRPADQARGTRSALRGGGMVAAVLGLNYAEYARRRTSPPRLEGPTAERERTT